MIENVPDFKILCQLMWLQGRNHFVMFLQVLMEKELKEAKRASKRSTTQACFKAPVRNFYATCYKFIQDTELLEGKRVAILPEVFPTQEAGSLVSAHGLLIV